MSAVVCGKRSFFEDIESAAASPNSASPPVYKKYRCSSATSPVRLSYSHPVSQTPFDQLKALFPDMETRLIEKTLEEYGDDLDSAIKSLHELRLAYANGNSNPGTEENESVDNGIVSNNGDAVPLSEIHVQNSAPLDGAEWIDLFVREMMRATSVDDAKSRAASILESLEKSLSATAGALASQSFHKENMIMKQQIEALLKENMILKRAVAIQHERQKEYDERTQEVHQLKQLVAQYQEQLRTLELNNYTLTILLRQAEQSSSIPGRFHPDVF